APFNIQLIGNQIFVTCALKRSDGKPLLVGSGGGVVNIFDTIGNFVKRFVSPDGPINAPWGIVQAGANFGPFSNDILIANAGGDGRVSAFDPNTGDLAGQIMDGTGNPLFFLGMHALAFRADGIGDANTLYYVDGAAEGATPHGSFSTITTGRAAFMAFTFFNTTLRAAAFPGDPIVLTASIDTRSGTPTGTVVFVDTCCTLNP